MNFILLATSIIFFFWVFAKAKAAKNKEAEQDKAFWERESRANSTRRKPLDDLDYINIPFDALPFDKMCDDEQIASYHATLRVLAETPIVNLSCISNTELKLRYGAPNITLLSKYDSAYTALARTLQQWAQALYEAGYVDAARLVLEFAIQTKTDISATYLLLARIYRDAGEAEKIAGLIAMAQGLDLAAGKRIAQKLRDL